VRVHPAIVAHAAATASLLLDGRLVLGVGTGEALNEHVVGARWPAANVRREMLEEAIEIMRALWTGETVDCRGRYYEVENAKLFDPPARAIPIVVSGFGPEAAGLAGRIGDGYWGTSPDQQLLSAYEQAGGTGPRYAQLNLCWAPDAERARETVHRFWPTGGLSGQLSQDLPTWTHFEQAVSVLTMDQTTESTPCGPDLIEAMLESVDDYLRAGYDHLYFHQIGTDQDGFFRFWAEELRPALERHSVAT
jgi:G6PDH family F420-dependent oxidoreductase